MNPSQPYAAPSGPPPPPTNNFSYAEQGGFRQKNDTAPFSQATEKTGQRLNPRKRLNDPVPLVLFLAAVAGFAAVSGIAISSFISVNGLGGGFGNAASGETGTGVTLDYHTVYLLLIVCAIGLVIAAIYLAALRAFTRVIIEVTLALTVILNIGICIY